MFALFGVKTLWARGALGSWGMSWGSSVSWGFGPVGVSSGPGLLGLFGLWALGFPPPPSPSSLLLPALLLFTHPLSHPAPLPPLPSPRRVPSCLVPPTFLI
eukprot:4459763-Pyramimonas_sp.AAC.1